MPTEKTRTFCPCSRVLNRTGKGLRFPDYVTIAQNGGKVVKLTHWPFLLLSLLCSWVPHCLVSKCILKHVNELLLFVLFVLFLLLLILIITFMQNIYNYVPKTTMFLGYVLLQLTYSYSLWLHVMLLPMLNVSLLLLSSSSSSSSF